MQPIEYSVNPAFCTYAAKRAADGEGVYPLGALLRAPSGDLWAGGMYQLLVSRDEGASWNEVTSVPGCETSSVKALLSIDGFLLVFLRVDGEVRVVRSPNAGRDWNVVGSLPDSFCLFAGAATSAAAIAAAGQDRSGVTVWCSRDAGASWLETAHLPTDGTLLSFGISESGDGVIGLIESFERPAGAENRTELVPVSCLSGKVRSSAFVDFTVQSCLGVGGTRWLLGADGGMLFSYDSLSGTLEVQHAFDNPDLSISGLESYRDKVIAVGETSDPPPSVGLFLRAGRGWEEHRTDLSDYLSAVKGVADGVVLMTQTGLYKCFAPLAPEPR